MTSGGSDDLTERGARHDRVVVIGGGLSGLTAAHRLAERARAERRPVEVVVLEARDRVGGTIWTRRVDGFTLEGGPDAFISNKPWAVDLCRRLGLGDQLVGTDPQHRRSFVVRDGRVLPLPEGFVVLAPGRILPLLTTPILSFRGKLRMLLDLVLPRNDDDADESLASFVKRRLGREVFDRLVEPLVAGVYTADPGDLSLRATLPRFLRMEERHRSLLLAALREGRRVRAVARASASASAPEAASSGGRFGLFTTLLDGMDALPGALAAGLPPGAVRLKTAVRRVSRSGTRSGWVVDLLDGPPLEADALIVATEAHASARLLDGVDPAMALQLRSIPYASSVILNLAFRRDQVAHPLDGFGVVVPAAEKRSMLAVSFLSVKFPNRAPAGTVLLRAFLGGATRPDLYERDDDALVTMARAELYELLGVKGEPLLVDVARHPRAMPQYTLGHLDRAEAVRRHAARLPGLFLATSALDGVGIPDTIHSAELAADAALAALADAARSAAA